MQQSLGAEASRRKGIIYVRIIIFSVKLGFCEYFRNIQRNILNIFAISRRI